MTMPAHLRVRDPRAQQTIACRAVVPGPHERARCRNIPTHVIVGASRASYWCASHAPEGAVLLTLDNLPVSQITRYLDSLPAREREYVLLDLARPEHAGRLASLPASRRAEVARAVARAAASASPRQPRASVPPAGTLPAPAPVPAPVPAPAPAPVAEPVAVQIGFSLDDGPAVDPEMTEALGDMGAALARVRTAWSRFSRRAADPATLDALRADVRRLTRENDRLARENATLSESVRRLSADVERLIEEGVALLDAIPSPIVVAAPVPAPVTAPVPVPVAAPAEAPPPAATDERPEPAAPADRPAPTPAPTPATTPAPVTVEEARAATKDAKHARRVLRRRAPTPLREILAERTRAGFTTTVGPVTVSDRAERAWRDLSENQRHMIGGTMAAWLDGSASRLQPIPHAHPASRILRDPYHLLAPENLRVILDKTPHGFDVCDIVLRSDHRYYHAKS